MKRSAKIGLILLMLLAGGLGGCRSCTRAETCDECVARCVDQQKVSPDVCRTTACASVCNKR
jgi:hypothetical protein